LRPDKRVHVVDLFSGAGGLSAGAMAHGLTLGYAFDSDRRAARTYEFNFPRTPVAKLPLKRGEIKEMCATLGLQRGSVDILLAGPPCQGFSISNLRTRNRLNPANHAWESVIEMIALLRPQGVIIENVGGIESYENGSVARSIEGSLQSMGYTVKRYLLDAADFGVPQHRKRVFFLAVRFGTLPDKLRPQATRKVTVKSALLDLPKVPNGNQADELPYRLHGKALTAYQRKMRRATNGNVRNCKTSKSTSLIVRRFARVRQGGNWADIPEALFTTYAKKDNCHRWLYRRLSEDRPAVTISNFRKNMLIHPWQNRTLSVREAARLQALHDGFVLFGNLQSQQQQIANAVPPPVGAAVVRTILRCIRTN
jgi:DNA (cytosine-5)-methyltransferase 1